MSIELTMPKFGLTMHEGTLQRFFKAPGEAVAAGEPLYEVETEKVLYVVEAPASGTLAAWFHGEGTIVECGRAVAIIAEAGEDAVALAAGTPAGAGAAARSAAAPSAPSAPAAGAAAAGADGDGAHGAASAGRRAVSPVARKLAAQLRVDLDRVNGTGPGGRVTREDVERAAKGGGAQAAAAAGRNFAATSRCTTRDSVALHTLGRWVLPLTSSARAMSRSAEASTYRWQLPSPSIT